MTETTQIPLTEDMSKKIKSILGVDPDKKYVEDNIPRLKIRLQANVRTAMTYLIIASLAKKVGPRKQILQRVVLDNMDAISLDREVKRRYVRELASMDVVKSRGAGKGEGRGNVALVPIPDMFTEELINIAYQTMSKHKK